MTLLQHKIGVSNLVKEIELISKNILIQLGGKREYEIIKRRYGLEGSKILTIDQLGALFQINRSHIRHLEMKSIGQVSRVLLGRENLLLSLVPENIVEDAIELRGYLIAQDKIITLTIPSPKVG